MTIKWLLIAVFFKQLVFVGLTPLWHFPDEQAHWAMVQIFAEVGSLEKKTKGGGDLAEEVWVSEKLLGTDRDQQGNNRFTYHPEYRLEYTDNSTGKYENQISDLPLTTRTHWVKTEAARYPPLYYWLTARIYELVYPGNLFVRVFAVRAAQSLLIVGTVYLAWKIGAIIFANHRQPALMLAWLVAFHPMLSFVSAGVNSDNLFNPLFTAWLYFSSLIITQGLNRRRLLSLTLVLIAGFYTKPQMIVALGLTPIAISLIKNSKLKIPSLRTRNRISSIYCHPERSRGIWLGAWLTKLLLPDFSTPLPDQGGGSRGGRNDRVVWFQVTNFKNWTLVAGGLLLSLVLGLWAVTLGPAAWVLTFIQTRSFSPINPVSFFGHLKWSLAHTIREVIPWYWGVFDWLGVVLPRWVNRVQARLLVVTAVGIGTWLFKNVKSSYRKSKQADTSTTKHRSSLSGVEARKSTTVSGFDPPEARQSRLSQENTTALLWLWLVAAVYFAAVTFWDWLFIRSHGFSFGIQGRYFFPAVVPHMSLILIGLTAFIPRKWHRWFYLLLATWWLALTTIALWTIARTYYDLSSIHTFLIQLSQYKPWFFKAPGWLVVTGLYFLSLLTAARSFIADIIAIPKTSST
jgi:hypothetical protein